MHNIVTIVTILLAQSADCLDSNSVGYVMYCPCMGRFGNQAEHFLGALAFTKGLNRTLVVPPWVEYPPGRLKSHQEPYSSYFKLSALEAYLPVISMEKFMSSHSETIWPSGHRDVLCYQARGDSPGCNAKEGNPFGPFWDTFNIDFDGSQFFGPLSFDTKQANVANQWNTRFPKNKYPVLPFTGAPAAFPVLSENGKLTKYMEWSEAFDNTANSYINNEMAGEEFLGVHIRSGVDWERACNSLISGGSIERNMFGSQQCLGPRMENGRYLTHELCYPPSLTYEKQLKKTLEKTGVNHLFIATDKPAMLENLKNKLKKSNPDVKVLWRVDAKPHVDLAILTKAKHFIGNCVSTFSAFVTRYRLTRGTHLPNTFWAFKGKTRHLEL